MVDKYLSYIITKYTLLYVFVLKSHFQGDLYKKEFWSSERKTSKFKYYV
jgi:hypothetical protein